MTSGSLAEEYFERPKIRSFCTPPATKAPRIIGHWSVREFGNKLK
jgi:hypothetical protein